MGCGQLFMGCVQLFIHNCMGCGQLFMGCVQLFIHNCMGCGQLFMGCVQLFIHNCMGCGQLFIHIGFYPFLNIFYVISQTFLLNNWNHFDWILIGDRRAETRTTAERNAYPTAQGQHTEMVNPAAEFGQRSTRCITAAAAAAAATTAVAAAIPQADGTQGHGARSRVSQPTTCTSQRAPSSSGTCCV